MGGPRCGTVVDTVVCSSLHFEIVDYVAVSALLVGAVLVNCGIMMVLKVWTLPKFGALTVVLGAVLLVVSIASLQRQTHLVAGDSEPSATGVEFRTPVVERLTVRVGPGTEYEHAASIWQVHPGDRLRVVEDSLGWIRFHVKYFDPDWSGWVPREYTTSWDTYQEIQRIRRITKASPSERSR